MNIKESNDILMKRRLSNRLGTTREELLELRDQGVSGDILIRGLDDESASLVTTTLWNTNLSRETMNNLLHIHEVTGRRNFLRMPSKLDPSMIEDYKKIGIGKVSTWDLFDRDKWILLNPDTKITLRLDDYGDKFAEPIKYRKLIKEISQNLDNDFVRKGTPGKLDIEWFRKHITKPKHLSQLIDL